MTPESRLLHYQGKHKEALKLEIQYRAAMRRERKTMDRNQGEY